MTIDVVLTDRIVDLRGVRRGVPHRHAARLIARRLSSHPMVICAFPDYLARAGMPAHPTELADHDTVAFTLSARSPWQLTREDEAVEVMPRRPITVNGGRDARVAA